MSTEVQVEDMPADQLEPGEVIGSRYRVEQLWRDHPLGELYCCRDLAGGGRVALQRLRREFAGDGVRDRLFETRGRAALGTTLVLDILDYGVDLDHRPFLVGPWIEALTLAELERPLGFHEALQIIERLATALSSAHAERLVHGGLEPSSVLIERDEASRARVVGLLGFGLVPALGAGAEKSRSLPLVMSPAYIAPELIGGAPLSPAADVYALGVLLWELIHGAPPFRGPTLRVLDAHLNRALPELELPFDAPPAFDWVLRRMLAKNPVDRFADAGAVAAQLREFAVDEDATLVFDRRPVKVSAATKTGVELSLPAQVVEAPEWAPVRNRARSWTAALVILTTLALALWVGVSRWSSPRIEAIEVFAAATSERLWAQEAAAEALAVGRPDAPPPADLAAPLPELAPLPAKLSAASFRAHKTPLYANIEARCVDDPIRRTVKVAVRVNPDGQVRAAKVLGSMASTGLGRCVRRQAQRLRFPGTRAGGSYVYTLRLR